MACRSPMRASSGPRQSPRIPLTYGRSSDPARSISSMAAQSLRRLQKALKTARSLQARKGDYLMLTDMEAEVLVEGSRVQEDVDGDAIEHQPALARNTCQIGWVAQFLGEDQWPGHIR
jgi:hypothetical protein